MFQSIEYKHPKFLSGIPDLHRYPRVHHLRMESVLFRTSCGIISGRFLRIISAFAGDLPEIPAHSCSIHTAECPVKYHPCLHRVQIHRTEIHTLLDPHDHSVEYFRRHTACLCIYTGRHAEQCVRRSDQRICHQSVSKLSLIHI